MQIIIHNGTLTTMLNGNVRAIDIGTYTEGFASGIEARIATGAVTYEHPPAIVAKTNASPHPRSPGFARLSP
jgi:hypothetical protein